MHKKFWITAFLCNAAVISLTSCASTKPADPSDPYQDYNRHMYTINDTIDRAVFKPIATLYQTVTPSFVRTGVTNAFNNLHEIPTVFNDALQGNGYNVGKDSWRFLINSTVGVAGFFDVATKMGLQRNDQDFGLTLAKWGYSSSNYLVLPLVGPSTVRDGFGFPVDYVTNPCFYLDNPTDYSLSGLNLINKRANLLSYDAVRNEAFDPYIAVRNAFMQKRNETIANNTYYNTNSLSSNHVISNENTSDQ